jgi:hypothetical protein
MRLKVGDRAGIQGNMGVRVEYGAPIITVNVSAVTVIRLAVPALRLVASNVEAANSKLAQRNTTADKCAQQANSVT